VAISREGFSYYSRRVNKQKLNLWILPNRGENCKNYPFPLKNINGEVKWTKWYIHFPRDQLNETFLSVENNQVSIKLFFLHFIFVK